MAARIDWLIPGQVIYQRWWGTGTLDDMRQMNQQSLDMFAEYPTRPQIHFVVNGIGQKNNEGGITQIRRIYTVLDHAQMGWIILVVDSPLLRLLCNIVLRIGRPQARIVFINRMDEWRDILREHDPTIEWYRLNLDVIDQLEAETQAS